jgi:hypothetical protein
MPAFAGMTNLDGLDRAPGNGKLNLSHLLVLDGTEIGVHQIGVARHVPNQPELQRALPWLAAEKHEIYNAYQQAQRPGATILRSANYLVSCISYGKDALYVGTYKITGQRLMLFDEYWKIPANQELRRLGMSWDNEDADVIWFDLEIQANLGEWKGKLVFGWPPGRRWDRWLDGGQFPVKAILEDSALDRHMPAWDRLVLTWAELQNLPSRWVAALEQWRGVYLIHDRFDGKAYVGSAYGDQNLYGRWLNYAASGDGGNRLLRSRNAEYFLFSILQRVSPDMEPKQVIGVEATWKDRLHTREFGLNLN